MAAGAVSNVARQTLKKISGKQCDFDLVSLASDTLIGGATGILSGARIPGLTSGRGSYNQVYKQMVTKWWNGTASSITVNTATKMVVGRFADQAILEGSVVAGAELGLISRMKNSSSSDGNNCK